MVARSHENDDRRSRLRLGSGSPGSRQAHTSIREERYTKKSQSINIRDDFF